MKRPGFNGWEFSRIEQRYKWKCPLKLKQEKYKWIHSQPYRELENIRVGYSNPLGFFYLFIFEQVFYYYYFFTLQYCIGFAIHQHESAMGVHVFPILNPPLSSLLISSLWVIPVTSPKLPVSCIKPGLAIHFLYDIIHISMPFSKIIPLPSPTESKRLFCTSVSLLLRQQKNCCFWTVVLEKIFENPTCGRFILIFGKTNTIM